MRCFYCKRKINNGEKTATIQTQIGDWVGHKHIICLNCAEQIGLPPKANEEDKNADN